MDRPGVSEPNSLVAWSILGYLCSHPHARDTASGVARWWLAAGGSESTHAEVEKALNHLAESGWVIVFRSPARQPIYGLNPTRLLDIQGLTGGPPTSQT